MHRKRALLLTCLLLGVVTVAAYWPVLHSQFVNYDDDVYVRKNPHVLSGLTWQNVRWAITDKAGGNWHPLTWMSHMLDCQLYGLNPAGHHLTNLLFHTANSILIFLLLRRMTGAQWRSAFVAALFALHPLHVESVAWVAERKDVLSTLFWALTLLAYVRYVSRRSKVEGREQRTLTRSLSHRMGEGGRRPGEGPGEGLGEGRGEGSVQSKQKANIQRPTSNIQRPTRTEETGTSRPRSAPSGGEAKRRRLDYFLVLLCFALGLMAKSMLVTLPFLLLLLDFWPLRRIQFSREQAALTPPLSHRMGEGARLVRRSLGEGGRAGEGFVQSKQKSNIQQPTSDVQSPTAESADMGTGRPHSVQLRAAQLYPSDLRTLLLEKVPLLVLSALSCVATFWSQGTAVGGLHLSLPIRVENGFLSYLKYIEKTFWPTKLALLYPFSSTFQTWHVLAAILCVLGLTLLAIRYARKFPYLFTGWFWFLGTLVPVIGIVQVGLQSMANRYTYVPLIGLFIIIAWGGFDLAARLRFRPVLISAVAGVVILACLPITRFQVSQWKNSLDLFTYAIRSTTNNYVAENNLALALMDRGEMDQAGKHLARALEIRPDYAEALSNMGLVLLRQGKVDDGIARYRAAALNQPRDPELHHNLACALLQKDLWDEAIEEFEIALRLNPDFSQSRSDLARALAFQGRLKEAEAQWTKLLASEPANADDHANLGLVLAAENDFSQGIVQLQTAVNLNPTNVQVRVQLASILDNAGRTKEAVEHYRRALALEPGIPGVLNNLAWIFAANSDPQIRNGAEAVRLAEQACALTQYQEPVLVSTLGAAYAEAGRFDKAVETARKAEALAKSAGNESFAERNGRMAQMFLTRQPFHDASRPAAQK
ncbi:MAG TPA: tetratricopeptide repeat protein [Verrucomicrobiae bacterium]|nr:tetratricopeptide repeat protein [Verrucomicrobiae bacterium]